MLWKGNSLSDQFANTQTDEQGFLEPSYKRTDSPTDEFECGLCGQAISNREQHSEYHKRQFLGWRSHKERPVLCAWCDHDHYGHKCDCGCEAE